MTTLVATSLLTRWQEYFQTYLRSGVGTTALMWLVASATTVVWALPVALCRSSRFALVRFPATAYIEFFRGTPQLVQMLAIFAGLPLIGIEVAPWPSAIIALTLNAGTYMAEAYRSGFQAVSRGQREAASSLGMSRTTALRRVILPQVGRIAQPAIGQIVVAILLSTSFVFLVGVVDLTAQGNTAYQFTIDFSVYYEVTLIYLVLALAATALNSWLERRLRIPG
jgi:His/Glu/Gln/Arg/opine family amino acid ABC transporter permease subunit